MSLRIYIVDDHPIFRLGLTHLLNSRGMNVCGEAGTVSEALKDLVVVNADVIVVDIGLADGSGLRLLETLRERPDAPPAVVVSMHDESIYARRALEAGALGYVSKAVVSQQIITAVEKVSRGRLAVSDSLRDSLFQRDGLNTDTRRWLTRLSNRELEVFNLIGQTASTRDVADTLQISVKTVETHQAKIKIKLGITSMAELIRIATLWSNSPTDP